MTTPSGTRQRSLAAAAAPGVYAENSTDTADASTMQAQLTFLRTCGETLEAIGSALGVAAGALAAAEAIDRLEIEAVLRLEALTAIDTANVAIWYATFAGDLALDLRLRGLDDGAEAPAAELRDGRDPQGTLKRFVVEAKALATTHGEDVAVEARLAVAKTRVVRAASELLVGRREHFGVVEMRERTRVVVFYSSAALERLLTLRALPDWQRLGLVREDGRAFVVVCDHAGYLAGLALEILGARETDLVHWLEVSRAAWRQFQERSAQARALHAAESHWSTAPSVLTPAHLRLSPRASGLEPLSEAVAETRAALAAAYLAPSVHTGAAEDLTLRFGGARPASCHVPRDRGMRTPGAFAGDCLARLATWAYDNASADKLAIARECLARELPPGGSVALADVERAAAPALEAARANFALYLRGNAGEYFRLRERALEAVAEYAAGVRKAVADLTSDVVDNVYRTVGLLAGVVIAALVQPALALPVQRVAAALYVAYLAFVMFFLLRAREQRFTLEAAEVTARFDAMPELGERERQRLRAQASAADAHFARYLRLSRMIYTGLALAGALYFLALWTPLAPHLPLASAGTPTPAPQR